ncbi:hypothetical protein O1611_g6991 [Lasiodiplodia mahajangana]|uniref:Uncharacterized protein n=1 Tax=Lasiodiplodia mahajangana TaxID=1108764 RepID=A0ACC2JH12_9PEZI|nr:hypothetical protein O1611_g6991 [Lasiodiplodia mahajangana]
MGLFEPLNVSLDDKLRDSPSLVDILRDLLNIICDSLESLKPTGDATITRRYDDDESSDAGGHNDQAENNDSLITDTIGGTRNTEEAKNAILELRLDTEHYIFSWFLYLPEALCLVLVEANAMRPQRLHRKQIPLGAWYPRVDRSVQLPKTPVEIRRVTFVLGHNTRMVMSSDKLPTVEEIRSRAAARRNTASSEVRRSYIEEISASTFQRMARDAEVNFRKDSQSELSKIASLDDEALRQRFRKEQEESASTRESHLPNNVQQCIEALKTGNADILHEALRSSTQSDNIVNAAINVMPDTTDENIKLSPYSSDGKKNWLLDNESENKDLTSPPRGHLNLSRHEAGPSSSSSQNSTIPQTPYNSRRRPKRKIVWDSDDDVLDRTPARSSVPATLRQLSLPVRGTTHSSQLIAGNRLSAPPQCPITADKRRRSARAYTPVDTYNVTVRLRRIGLDYLASGDLVTAQDLIKTTR